MAITSFRQLEIWQLGMKTAKDIYNLTKKYPREELYTLTSQMRRSALSVPSNIAEGFMRKHKPEYKQFLSISLGSLGELETQVEMSSMLEYITKGEKEYIMKNIEHIRRKTLNLIKCINKELMRKE